MQAKQAAPAAPEARAAPASQVTSTCAAPYVTTSMLDAKNSSANDLLWPELGTPTINPVSHVMPCMLFAKLVS